MIVAHIIVTTGRFSMGQEKSHVVGFNDLEKAKAEYARIKDFIQRKGDKQNDIPATIEIDGGTGGSLTCPFDSITSLGLLDFALAEEHEKGTQDAFPLIFRGKK